MLYVIERDGMRRRWCVRLAYVRACRSLRKVQPACPSSQTSSERDDVSECEGKSGKGGGNNRRLRARRRAGCLKALLLLRAPPPSTARYQNR